MGKVVKKPEAEKKTIKIKKNHLRILLIVLVFVVMSFIVFKVITKPSAEVKVVREPAVAGLFYPETNQSLSNIVEEFYSNANQIQLNATLRGLVSPHAGYRYSGQVAAQGFNLVDKNTKTVIILAPSHHALFNGASIDNATHYKTPLGEVKLSPKVGDLRKEDIIVYFPNAHPQEHAVEVQLPFLQKKLESFEIIPIVTSNVDPEQLADVLIPYIDDSTLVVASSDLSHYYPYDTAVQLDSYCIKSIPKLNFTMMQLCEACGNIPILTLMHIAEKKGWKGLLLDYKNSGDVTDDKTRVVGYASIAFYEPGIGEHEQKVLLELARQTLEYTLKNNRMPMLDKESFSPSISKVQGCFVTLNKNDQLRGCIGHIIPQEPLYKCVFENSINAALYDRRFLSVTYDELKDIEIEISVLTVPQELKFSDTQDLLNKLRLLVDGVVLEYQGRSSTFLPQVWEQIPDKEDFLTNLCIKQGSMPDCWKEQDVKIETYQAQVFAEE